MRVRELIERLSVEDPNADVLLPCLYGGFDYVGGLEVRMVKRYTLDEPSTGYGNLVKAEDFPGETSPAREAVILRRV